MKKHNIYIIFIGMVLLIIGAFIIGYTAGYDSGYRDALIDVLIHLDEITQQ